MAWGRFGGWWGVRCGTRDGACGEAMGGTMNAPFLSARFGRFHIAIVWRGVLGEFSAFSTVSKYNTQERRRMASSDGIHNTNTNRHGFPFIELVFGVRA